MVRLPFWRVSAFLIIAAIAATALAAHPSAASSAAAEENGIDNSSVLAYLSGLPEPQPVSLPWQAGRFSLFLSGSAEEDGRVARGGRLAGQLYRAPRSGRAPYAVLLAGCGGTYIGANGLWLKLWARTLRDIGFGALALNSFEVRGIEDGVCGDGSRLWAQRRVDDAYSALNWLADQPFVDARRIVVMGMSNGARAALLAVGAGETWRFRRFAAAVALYPACDEMPRHDLLAPALLLLGQADDVARQPVCEAYVRARQTAIGGPRLVVYPDAFHLFDVYPRHEDYTLPEVLDAREQVKGFLRPLAGADEASGPRTAPPAH